MLITKQCYMSESEMEQNPVLEFKKWYELAAISVPRHNAMSLATATTSGVPSSRVVLLTSFDDDGFVFYTTYLSRKGAELAQNPHAALLFFWAHADETFQIERQIRIEGIVEKVPEAVAAVYFNTLPTGSKLRALAGQSAVIDSREELEIRISALTETYAGKDIQMPDYWGGFVVKPHTFEFLQTSPDHIHDRFRYTLNSGNWLIERLMP